MGMLTANHASDLTENYRSSTGFPGILLCVFLPTASWGLVSESGVPVSVAGPTCGGVLPAQVRLPGVPMDGLRDQ